MLLIIIIKQAIGPYITGAVGNLVGGEKKARKKSE